MRDFVLETKLLLAKASDNELKIPDPDETWKERTKELTEGKLIKQRSSVIHDMRIEQAKKMGFEKIDDLEAVKLLMGETHTRIEKGERSQYDYLYIHHEDMVCGVESDWGIPSPFIYINEVKSGFRLFKPQFSRTELKWRVIQITKLDNLKKQIPYDVVAGINGLKRLRFFNSFRALVNEKNNDAIILGELFDLPPKEDGSRGKDAYRIACFFLAKF